MSVLGSTIDLSSSTRGLALWLMWGSATLPTFHTHVYLSTSDLYREELVICRYVLGSTIDLSSSTRCRALKLMWGYLLDFTFNFDIFVISLIQKILSFSIAKKNKQ